jgi:hypothetical protein
MLDFILSLQCSILAKTYNNSHSIEPEQQEILN